MWLSTCDRGPCDFTKYTMHQNLFPNNKLRQSVDIAQFVLLVFRAENY